MRFIDCFEKLIEDRIESTNDEIANEQWYLELQDKLIELQNKNPLCKAILTENNSINYEIFNETTKKLYRQAFMDGVEAAMIMAPKMAPK